MAGNDLLGIVINSRTLLSAHGFPHPAAPARIIGLACKSIWIVQDYLLMLGDEMASNERCFSGTLENAAAEVLQWCSCKQEMMP